jgi:hypothetical protein
MNEKGDSVSMLILAQSRHLCKHIILTIVNVTCQVNVTPALLPRRSTVNMLAIKRHNGFQTRDVPRESPGYVASQWILACFSEALCLFIARESPYILARGRIEGTEFDTRGCRKAVLQLEQESPAYIASQWLLS